VKIIIILISLFLSSCSSLKWSSFFSDDDESSKRNEKLMESFGVEDDVLEKFEAKKEVEEQTVESKVSSNQKEDTPQKPSVKSVTKTVTKKTTAKLTKKQENIKKSESKPVKKVLPEDYPKTLREISKSTKSYWKDYKPIFKTGERFYLDINYMGVSTGKIVLSTLDPVYIGSDKTYHFNAKVKTANYYRYLYELDDTVDSYFSANHHVPLKFSLIQRESDKDVDDLQLFDLEQMKTYTFYKKVTDKKTKKKKKEQYIPKDFVDPLSVLYFLRGLPMIKGSSYEIPIMNQGKIIMLNTTVVGTREIETKIGRKEAFVMKASSKYSGDTLKSGDMTFYFSSDENRIFLKFEAEIKIGSITGEIEKYEQ